ncbi:MAG: hypothetical protein GYA47_07095 [Desulfovibrio sp.]|nr:hypothetical protein [Desulfovibrio sp.]
MQEKEYYRKLAAESRKEYLEAEAKSAEPGASVPVIPVDVTIEVTVTYGSSTTTYPYKILEGRVTGQDKGRMPGAQDWIFDNVFEGSIEKNIISGVHKTHLVRNESDPKNCKTFIIDTKTNVKLTLHPDGSVTVSNLGGTSENTGIGCPGGNTRNTGKVPATTVQGRWRVVK